MDQHQDEAEGRTVGLFLQPDQAQPHDTAGDTAGIRDAAFSVPSGQDNIASLPG